MAQKTIFYPPVLNWNFMFQRPQQIMRQFAKLGWRAIYCNPSPDPGGNNKIVEVEPNLFVCDTPELAISLCGGKVDVLYQTWGKQHHYAGLLDADVVWYDCVDKFSQWEKFEQPMLDSADVVTATAQPLADKLVWGFNGPVHLLRNAASTELCETGVINMPEMDKLQHPIVGFIGCVGPWVDTVLLEEIAKDVGLVIAGPVTNRGQVPSATWLGEIAFDRLAGVYQQIDVGICPFRFQEVAIYACPIKLYEYASMGVPAVATPIPEACYLGDRDVLTVAEPNRFNAVVKAELAKVGTEQARDERVAREKFAMHNTWGHRVQEILPILEAKAKELGV